MTLLVGWSPEKDDDGALRLGTLLARSSGRAVLVVVTVPSAWPTPVAGASDRDFTAWAAERGRAGVAAAEAWLAEHAPDVAGRAVAVPARSVASGLLDAAERHEASAIVVGSAAHGRAGVVALGSVADRLVHSSPVPVAIAPRGADVDAPRVSRVTCAFRGDDASWSVLDRTAALCREVGASLRVATLGVRGRTMYPPEVLGEDDVLAAYVEATAAAQERAVAGLGDAAPTGTTTAVATGRTWEEALATLDWRPGEVLVLGSSSSGPVARLFLGSRAAKIVREAPVPVVLVP